MIHSSALPGPHNVHREVLANGLTVLISENHAAPVAVVQGALAAGSIHDPAGKSGLGNLVAELLTHGTESRDFAAFNNGIEALGADFQSGCGSHFAAFSARCMNEDLADILELTADALQRPAFSAEEVEVVRDQCLVDLDERSQETDRMAALRFYETIYGDHPYGRPISGYSEAVAGFTVDEIQAFHSAHYLPSDAIIVVAGAVQVDAVLEQLVRRFGAWRKPEHPAAPIQLLSVPTYHAATEARVRIEGKAQADIVLGAPAVARRHVDYCALRVANNILGRFGMMGRIGEEVREQLGLAYYCGSELDLEFEGGVWMVSAGVNPANVDAAIGAIRKEIERLSQEAVGAQELEDNRASMIGALPLALETNMGVAATLLEMQRLDLGLDYLLTYADNIYGVQADDIQRVAAAYLAPDRLVTVVAGP